MLREHYGFSFEQSKATQWLLSMEQHSAFFQPGPDLAPDSVTDSYPGVDSAVD